jgi:hypothetical protein
VIPPPVHRDDQLRAWLASHVVVHTELWVAEDRSARLVGILVLAGPWPDQLYVEPTMTGRAIGTSLMELAKRERPDGLGLWTFASNACAQRFYERHGFVERDRTEGTTRKAPRTSSTRGLDEPAGADVSSSARSDVCEGQTADRRAAGRWPAGSEEAEPPTSAFSEVPRAIPPAEGCLLEQSTPRDLGEQRSLEDALPNSLRQSSVTPTRPAHGAGGRASSTALFIGVCRSGQLAEAKGASPRWRSCTSKPIACRPPNGATLQMRFYAQLGAPSSKIRGSGCSNCLLRSTTPSWKTPDDGVVLRTARPPGARFHHSGVLAAGAVDMSSHDELREILLTVSPRQFKTLAGDLKVLRQHGAESNTRAIIEAVHERATRIRVGEVDERSAA